MVRVWLSLTDPPPSWSAMVEALEAVEKEDIASQIRAKYLNIQQYN